LAYLLLEYVLVSVQELIVEKHTSKALRVYPLYRDELWKSVIIEQITLLNKGLLDIEFDLDNLVHLHGVKLLLFRSMLGWLGLLYTTAIPPEEIRI
jgi:hypothetical protein